MMLYRDFRHIPGLAVKDITGMDITGHQFLSLFGSGSINKIKSPTLVGDALSFDTPGILGKGGFTAGIVHIDEVK
jgi:hypothetical protein